VVVPWAVIKVKTGYRSSNIVYKLRDFLPNPGCA